MPRRLKAGSKSAPSRPKKRAGKARNRPPAEGSSGGNGQTAQGPPTAATAMLEHAMLSLQRHEYTGAQDVLQRLLDEFPSERALADRARVYLELCQRELAARATVPQTIEERLTAATAALNNDLDADAEQLARLVLAQEPEHDLALYLLATVEARRGKAEAALQYLSQAVAVSPEAGAQARHDPDFEILHGSALFEELTELHLPEQDTRRGRNDRAER